MGGQLLPGGTSEISGDNVGRVPVQAAAGTVVPHSGAGIGARGGFPHAVRQQRDRVEGHIAKGIEASGR